MQVLRVHTYTSNIPLKLKIKIKILYSSLSVMLKNIYSIIDNYRR